MGFWFTFFLWVASFVITDYFRQRLPEQTPAGLGDFRVPTATEGRYVPLCFGTMVIEGPNVVWYGDFRVEEVTVETGVIFKEDETVGFRYFLGMQMGLIRGEVAGLRRIWIGDEEVWNYVTDNGGVLGTVMDVVKPDLYGGERSGGGFIGRFRLFNGDNNQGTSAYLGLSKHGITNLPAYRGYAYLVLTDLAETGGAEVGESNSVRNMKFEIQTYDTLANGGLGNTLGLSNDEHIIGDDLNPIVVAYDIYTNQDWGRGFSQADINVANFQARATQVFNEGIGFSVVIDNVRTAADFLDAIEQHIDGYIGPNPVTGQIEVSLARQDYSITASPEEVFFADETNVISVSKFSRGDWAQTQNEVLLQFTDRAKDYNDGYAPAQDLANLIIQGRPRSRTIRYEGVHAASVANLIVWRELRSFSQALASCTVELNRTAWELRPGDIIVLTDAEVQITSLPCRITAIRQGDPLNQSLVADVVEDVFGTEVPSFADPPDTEFVPPEQTVSPFALEDMFAMEAPYIIIRQDTVNPNLAPRLYVAAARFSGGALIEYEFKKDSAGGSPEFNNVSFVGGGRMLVGYLRTSLPGPASGNGAKTIQVDPISGSLDELIGDYSPGIGNMRGVAVINPATSQEEWISFTKVVDDLGGIRLEGVYRGSMDTVVKVHPLTSPQTRIWFIWTGGGAIDPGQETVGATRTAALLPRSQTDAVLLSDSPEPPTPPAVTFLADSRYGKPLLPDRVFFNSSEWTTSDVDFDNVIEGPPDQQGINVTTLVRDWRNQDVRTQMFAGIRGDIWGDDQHEVEFWFYDLDDTPNPTRGDAKFNVTGGGSFVSDFGTIWVKGQYDPGVNSFNARVEIETSHIPTGQSLIRLDSKEVIFFDFTAIGTFVIPPEAVIFQLVTEGSAGSVQPRDLSDSNHKIVRFGAPEVIAPSPALEEVNAIDASGPGNRSWIWLIKDWYRADSGKNMHLDGDFTFEFVWVYDDPTDSQRIIWGEQQSGFSINGETIYPNHVVWGIQYDAGQDRFEWAYPSGGGFSSFNNTHGFSGTGAFTPVAGQPYRIMLTRKVNLDGSWTYRTFVDGIRVGENTISSPNTPSDPYTLSPLPIVHISIGRDQIFRTIAHSTANAFEGQIDAIRIIKGFALEAINYTPLGAEFPHPAACAFYWTGQLDRGQDHRRDSSGHEQATNWASGPRGPQTDELLFGHPTLEGTGVDSTTPNSVGAPYWGNTTNNTPFDLALQFGKFDFTVECFAYFRSLPSDKANGMALIAKAFEGTGDNDFFFSVSASNLLLFRAWADDGTNDFETLTEDRPLSPWPPSPITGLSPEHLEINTWYHFAAVREGDALSLYKGTLGGGTGQRVAHDPTFFTTGEFALTGGSMNLDTQWPLCIGRLYDGSPASEVRCIDGYIGEAACFKGEARYSGATYTIPTDVLRSPRRGVAIKPNNKGRPDWTLHCKFFARMDAGLESPDDIVDEGPQARTSNLVNGASINTSLQRYGTGCLDVRSSPRADAYGEIPTDDNTFDFGTDDFFFKTNVRFESIPTGSPEQIATFIAKWNRNQENAWRIGYSSSDGYFIEISDGNTSTITRTFAGIQSPEPVVGTWYELVVARRLSWVRIWLEGELIGEGFNDRAPPTGDTEPVRFGVSWFGGTLEDGFDGLIDETQICIGQHGDFFEETSRPDFGQNIMKDTVFQFDKDGGEDQIRWVDMNDCSPTNSSTNVVSGYDWTDRTEFSWMVGREFPAMCQWESNTTGRVEFDGSVDANLEGDDFTIELWMLWHNLNHLSGSEGIFAHYNSSGNNRSWALQFDGAAGAQDVGSPNLNQDILRFFWSLDGTNLQSLGYQWLPSPGTLQWHHLAVCREGDDLRLYIDGTYREWEVYQNNLASPRYIPAGSPAAQFFPGGSPGTFFAPGASADITIGALQSATNPADASFQQMRIVKGRALYDANFTPDEYWSRF